jgi:hypothetical protein
MSRAGFWMRALHGAEEVERMKTVAAESYEKHETLAYTQFNSAKVFVPPHTRRESVTKLS